MFAKILTPRNGSNVFRTSYSSLEIITSNPDKFEKWCFKNGHYIHISPKPESLRRYNDKFTWVKFYYRSQTGLLEFLEKTIGYFDPEYDPLNIFEKIAFKFRKHMGIFEKLPYDVDKMPL